MADVLSVIADIIKQDKQQKREHNKVMREVKKKMKEAEVSEEEGDQGDYSAFVQKKLKKYGVSSPAELSQEEKKKFFDEIDREWEGKNEKPEPEDEQADLGTRVKERMKAEDEEEPEDEDEDPVGDPDETEEEEEDMDEPSEEQLDKIADLVVQKLKDKAEDEADEEEEPESTEAEAGEEEEIDTKPKVEGTIQRNPHHRGMWEQALRKVYEEKVSEPIPEIIKSVGKELRDYALKNGGIDKNDFLKISDVMQKGKMPKAASINRMDTDPREFVFDLMAKTFGWKYTEQYGGIRFQHRRDYVESFQGGHVLQEHCGECGAMDHIEEVRMPEGLNKEGAAEFMAAASAAKKQGKKKFKFGDKEYPVTIKIDIPTEEVEVDEAKGEFEVKYASSKKGPIKVSKFNTLDDAKKFLAQVKGEGMNGIISKGGKPVKEEVELDEHCGECGAMDHIDEKKSDYEDQIKAYLAKGGKIQKGDRPNKRKIDMVTKGFMKKYGAMKKKEADLDAKDKEELEKMMGEAVINEAWIDNDARKVERKWSKMDKKAKKKWMDGVMAKAKKEGMPKDELMDILDDYGLTMEATMTGKDSDSIEGPAKGVKHKCPTHVKKEGFGYGKNISHTLSENVVDKMNIYWFDTQEISTLMPTSEVEVVTEGYHSMKNHREKFKSTNKIAEGYMVLPAIDRNKYTPMRGMEGPFPTMSGKVLYYDPKAGEYYDRDSDMYISYDQYMEYDKMSPSQRKQMDMGPLGDPKSKEYKAMERIKNKAEKMAKKNRLKAKNESVGMRFIRKHYQKDDE